MKTHPEIRAIEMTARKSGADVSAAVAAYAAQIHQAEQEWMLRSLAVFSLQAAPPFAELPAAWGKPVVDWIERLVFALADESASDAEALSTVERLIDSIPQLVEEMDTEAFADALEAGMGASVVYGAADALRKVGAGRVVTLSADEPPALGIAIAPLREAVAKLDRKTPIAAKLSSAQWSKVALALRERAMFSARVESVRFLGTLQDGLRKRLTMEKERLANGKEAFVDRSSFIADARKFAIDEGLDTTDLPTQRGSIRDIRSAKRLGLIWDMQTNQAAEYARWKMDRDSDVLDAYPAQRFVRIEARDNPRPEGFWAGRWRQAGADTGWQGALEKPMVALKTAPIWTALSIFGTPWPPFDWGSGMGLDDVDRDEAEALGLLPAGESVPTYEQGSDEPGFASRLEASVKDLDPELRQWLADSFGDQVEIEGDHIRWREERDAEAVIDSSDWLAMPNRKNPVSGVLQLSHVNGGMRRDIQNAMAAVDRVHDAAPLPKVPVTSAVSVGNRGQYDGRGGRPNEIAISKDGPWRRLTSAHEIGHLVDHQLLGVPGRFASSESPVMKAWLDAVNRSPTVRRIRADEGISEAHRRYLTDPVEMWSRSYAQYVAYEGGNIEMMRDLARVAHSGESHSQWTRTEFEPIMKQIRSVLQKLGAK